MSSFFVERCWKIREGQAGFEVRILAGKLAVGDRFDCVDGMGRQVRFHIQKVETKNESTTIVCEGPITFDDQFARFTVVTTPFPQPRPELPKPGRVPQTTTDDATFVKGWVRDWDYYHPLQQAVVLSVVRQRKTGQQIAEELLVTPRDIASAIHDMTNVVAVDSSTQEICLR